MYKILVIEDQQPLLEEISDALRLADYDVFGAENGLLGLRLPREQIPDLIISDIMMPELDGYGVLQELRGDSATAPIPFVFMTAKAEWNDLRKGVESDADHYSKSIASSSIRVRTHRRLSESFLSKTEWHITI